jgi:hypothetical protein
MLRKSVLLAGIVTAVAILAPTGASAATGACALGGTAHVSPGLTTKARSFKFTFGGSLNACQGGGTAKSGTLSASGTGTGTCAHTTGAGSALVSWNNGKTSAIKFTFSGVGNVVLVQGTITSGLFAGQKATAPIAFTSASPSLAACASTGITALKFSGAAIL